MLIYQIPIKKWLSLPLAGEVREHVNEMKVDDILIEMGKEPNSENRFEFRAELINNYIAEHFLDKTEEDVLKELGEEIKK